MFAFGGLFVIDILTGVLLFICYREFIAEYKYDYSILLATGIIFVLECLLYYSIRLFVYRKIPYFYEESPIDGKVESTNDDCNLDSINNVDVNALIDRINSGELHSINEFTFADIEGSVVNYGTCPEGILQLKTKYPSLIVHSRPLNEIHHINTLFAYSNYKLDDGGYVACKCDTSGIRRDHMMKQIPKGINKLIFVLDFIIHRVFPKLPITRTLYFGITKGRRRVLTRVEVLGRLYRAGFDVVYEKVICGHFYVVAQKIKEPIRDDAPSNGILIRMRRKGKDGKIIGVYKLRTMHAYSEYLQPYIYKTQGLCEGGKFADDYRVSSIGKFLRKTWIDELPMLINWLKGDMKLVGVRPLSTHYFSLYSKPLQELRIKVKPGLLPPFYADMPKTLEDIQDSEIRYIKAYLASPIKTDWQYLIKCINNIVFKGKRSK
ncbi:MAG: sugar transferase [Rikenellaceae bacterium]